MLNPSGNQYLVWTTDKGKFAVRPLDWAGEWNGKGELCGGSSTGIFEHEEDAKLFAMIKNQKLYLWASGDSAVGLAIADDSESVREKIIEKLGFAPDVFDEIPIK